MADDTRNNRKMIKLLEKNKDKNQVCNIQTKHMIE